MDAAPDNAPPGPVTLTAKTIPLRVSIDPVYAEALAVAAAVGAMVAEAAVLAADRVTEAGADTPTIIGG